MQDELNEEYELHEDAEIIDGIPTFDEILADPYETDTPSKVGFILYSK